MCNDFAERSRYWERSLCGGGLWLLALLEGRSWCGGGKRYIKVALDELEVWCEVTEELVDAWRRSTAWSGCVRCAMHLSTTYKFPKHRIWPILPGESSFLNLRNVFSDCPATSGGLNGTSVVCPRLLSAGPVSQPISCISKAALTIARSGMNRSPRTSTNRVDIAAMVCVVCCAQQSALQ